MSLVCWSRASICIVWFCGSVVLCVPGGGICEAAAAAGAVDMVEATVVVALTRRLVRLVVMPAIGTCSGQDMLPPHL